MIDALKDDRMINQMGGRFKFTALVQHRVRELMEGSEESRPLVERNGRTNFELAVQEIMEGKLTYDLTPDQPGEESEADSGLSTYIDSSA